MNKKLEKVELEGGGKGKGEGEGGGGGRGIKKERRGGIKREKGGKDMRH